MGGLPLGVLALLNFQGDDAGENISYQSVPLNSAFKLLELKLIDGLKECHVILVALKLFFLGLI